MITSYAESISDMAKLAFKKAKETGVIHLYPKMCDTCAFKWDQPHTLNYFLAADLAAGMLMSGGGQFNCHTHQFKDAGKPCAGFTICQAMFDNIEKEDSQPGKQ